MYGDSMVIVYKDTRIVLSIVCIGVVVVVDAVAAACCWCVSAIEFKHNLNLPQKFAPGSAWGIFVDFAPRVDQNSIGYFWFCVVWQKITQIDFLRAFVT